MKILDNFNSKKLENVLVQYNKRMPEPLSEDVLDVVLKVFCRNVTSGIGSGTSLDIDNTNLKKFRDGIYDRYFNSDNVNANLVEVFDKRLLEEDVVVTNIKVYASIKYDLFHKRKTGQRGLEDVDKNKILVNRARIRALMLSMLDSGRKYIPILVDEISYHNYEVCDGQGRFEACKALGIPVLFIVQDGGMTTKDIINVNKADEKPTAEEMVKMKAEDGRRPYQLLYNLLSYKYLNLNNIGFIIRGRDITSRDVFEDTFELTDEIYNKRINDLIWVNNMVEYMENFRKAGSELGVKPERFSYALALWTNFKNEVNIDEVRLKHQIETYLIDKPKIAQQIDKIVGKKSEPLAYVEVLDKIYNYGKSESEKVILLEKYLEYRRIYKWK